MEFGIERCAMLIMKSDIRQLTSGIELADKDKINTLAENETYKYLGLLEADTIKQAEMKEKNSERISQENYKTTRDKLNGKLTESGSLKPPLILNFLPQFTAAILQILLIVCYLWSAGCSLDCPKQPLHVCTVPSWGHTKTARWNQIADIYYYVRVQCFAMFCLFHVPYVARHNNLKLF